MTESAAETRQSPRMRRLWSDWMAMNELAQAGDLVEIAPGGDPPDRYRVLFRCRGLALMPDQSAPRPADRHICDIYLHRDYPQRPPHLIWRTPIFHPNILPPERGGAVCIGAWSPAETLAELVLRIGRMVQYHDYDLHDVLNQQAVQWVSKHRSRFPVDKRPLAPGY